MGAVGVVLAVLVLGACAGPTVTPRPSVASAPPAPSATPSPPATSAPTPAATPTPAVPPVVIVPPNGDTPERSGAIGLDWARAHTDRAVWGSSIEHGPGGWVHMLVTDGEIPNTPRLMFTADLRSWGDVTPEGDVVACSDGGSLAASTSMWLLRCGGLWRSPDGRDWESIAGTTDDGTPTDELRAVVSDGRSFVAVRVEYPADEAVWTSPDGVAWSRAVLPGAPYVRVDALIGRTGGGFVLAGRASDTAEGLREAHDMQWYSLPGTQAVWTSPDGAAWTSLTLGNAFVDGRITGLAADGPGGGIVAVGYQGENLEDGVEQIPTVWRSSDLTSWGRFVGPMFSVLESDLGAMRVVATVDRWLVMASRMREDAENIWDLTPVGVTIGSEDGTTWWATGPIQLERDGLSIADVAVADGRMVILGEANTSAQNPTGDATIWVSPPLD